MNKIKETILSIFYEDKKMLLLLAIMLVLDILLLIIIKHNLTDIGRYKIIGVI